MTTKYTEDHEWISVDGDIATVGITVHAQDALGDVVFVDLPEVGKTFAQKDVAGVVESVKAAADVYMPVSGEVTEVNEALRADPSLANSDPLKTRLVLQGQAVRPGPGRRLARRNRLHRLLRQRLIHFRRSPSMLMPSAKPLDELENPSEFVARHIGIGEADEALMLSVIGEASRRALIDGIVPRSIARSQGMQLPPAITEAAALAELKAIAEQNQLLKSFIGQGYHGTHTPGVILRNVLENPAWYTAYTPYQAEISQGRMEALINFQTMVCDLTGMAIANASMLDEATAAAEAMTLAKRSVKSKGHTFVVAGDCHPQTIEVVQTRAKPLGLTVKLANSAAEWDAALAGDDYFAVLAQYPSTSGRIEDLRRRREDRAGQRRGLHRRRRPAGAHAHHAARRVGRRHRGRHHAALRHAHGRGRPARRLHGLPRRVQTLAARPPGRRERGRARQPHLPPRAADARAAHPPREGHVQHLHGAGAAGRGGQHVRRVPRPGGPEAHRAARGRLHRRAGAGPGATGLDAHQRERLRHAHLQGR